MGRGEVEKGAYSHFMEQLQLQNESMLTCFILKIRITG